VAKVLNAPSDVMESKGMLKPIDTVVVTAMKRVSGTNKYTNYAFSAPKAT
jgi:hypothetical protein